MDLGVIKDFAGVLGVAVEAVVDALKGQQLELRRVAAPDATSDMLRARSEALQDRPRMRFVGDPHDTAPSKRESYND